MKRALNTKSLSQVFLSLCRRSVVVSVFIVISTCLVFIKVDARIVSVDVLYRGNNVVYLFGDYHGFGFGGESKEEKKQLVLIKSLIEQQKQKMTILVEDQLDLRKQKLEKEDSDYIPDFLLAGLVQRVQKWKNDKVDVYGIDCRWVLGDAFSFFNPFAIHPIQIKAADNINPYKLTVSEVFDEIETINKKSLNLLCCLGLANNFDVVMKQEMKTIQDAQALLLDCLTKMKINLKNTLYCSSIELFCKEMRDNVMESDSDQQLLKKLESALEDLSNQYLKKYPNAEADIIAKKIHEEFWSYIKQVTDSFQKIEFSDFIQHARPLCKLVHDALHKVIVHIFDPIVYLNVLKYLSQGSVVVFAGADHTKNVRDMLLKSGFTLCKDKTASCKYWEKLPLNKISF